MGSTNGRMNEIPSRLNESFPSNDLWSWKKKPSFRYRSAFFILFFKKSKVRCHEVGGNAHLDHVFSLYVSEFTLSFVHDNDDNDCLVGNGFCCISSWLDHFTSRSPRTLLEKSMGLDQPKRLLCHPTTAAHHRFLSVCCRFWRYCRD